MTATNRKSRDPFTPLTNAQIAEDREALEARMPKDNGLRTYPPMRSVDLIGGRQIIGYAYAADIRSSNAGLEFSGTWAECIQWAGNKGCLPAHLDR